MIALSAVQSFIRTLIHNVISFIDTSKILDATIFILQLGSHVTDRQQCFFPSVHGAGVEYTGGRVSSGLGIPRLGYPGGSISERDRVSQGVGSPLRRAVCILLECFLGMLIMNTW